MYPLDGRLAKVLRRIQIFKICRRIFLIVSLLLLCPLIGNLKYDSKLLAHSLHVVIGVDLLAVRGDDRSRGHAFMDLRQALLFANGRFLMARVAAE